MNKFKETKRLGKKPVLFMLVFAAIILFAFLIMQPLEVIRFKSDIAMLFPKGIIALKERDLLFILQGIMLLVIIPVYVFTFAFSWKYRAHNPKGIYDPDLVDNKLAEVVWWGIPFVFTVIICVLTWFGTYALDPFKPIDPTRKSKEIQVVALQWKWLFLYPEEKIATVNFVQFPKDTPLHFVITADAPMNSFWIPHLGGQIYAMPKMKTQLNLIAAEVGDYRGSSANLSGEGFAGMHFIARASTDEDYQKWVEEVKKSTKSLDWKEYTELAKPSSDTPVMHYQLKEDNIFDQVLMKFMHPRKE